MRRVITNAQPTKSQSPFTFALSLTFHPTLYERLVGKHLCYVCETYSVFSVLRWIRSIAKHHQTCKGVHIKHTFLLALPKPNLFWVRLLGGDLSVIYYVCITPFCGGMSSDRRNLHLVLIPFCCNVFIEMPVEMHLLGMSLRNPF